MTKINACLVLLSLITVCSCNRPANPPASSISTATSTANPAPADYTPKIGIAVSTSSRICMAIHNGNLTNGAVVTLVSPVAPVTYTPATISGTAQQPCPITQNVDTTISNYNLNVQGPIQKLTPMIVVLGTPAITINSSNIAQADLDQNGKTESFRACSADNGIHVSVWSGAPLQGTILWQAFYYESGNPGVGPACTPAETPAS